MTAPLRVAIEATRLVHERGGISRYVRNVLRGFAPTGDAVHCTLLVRSVADVAPTVALLDTLDPEGHGLAARSTVVPVREAPRLSVDVAWCPWNLISLPQLDAAMVVTICDIEPMLQLDHRWWKVIKRAKHRARFARTLRRADHVITISAFTRDELVRHLGATTDRITVTLLGADDPTLTGDDPAPLDQAGITGPFFLYVGGQDGRKNVGTLYDAMERLWAAGARVPLVQCGPDRSREAQAVIGTVPWLHHIGYVSDAQLVALYRRAYAFVMPSRYEGFGLPIAEAMRFGAPVICSAGGAMAEVSGDAAVHVPATDAVAFAAAMQRLVEYPIERDALAARSLARAAPFTWANTAAATLAVLQRAHTERQRPLATARPR